MDEPVFHGEYIISNPDEPLGFEPISRLSDFPLNRVVNALRKKYRERVEIMPLQTQGQPVQLNLGVYVEKGQKRYIISLSRTLPPATIDELGSLLVSGLQRLQLIQQSLQFNSDSYEEASKVLEDMLEEIRTS